MILTNTNHWVQHEHFKLFSLDLAPEKRDMIRYSKFRIGGPPSKKEPEMPTGVLASVIAPHTPRIGIEANVPDFQQGLVRGLREMGQALRALKPDGVVLFSSHWVSTFKWYTTSHEQHEGICIADEAPDLIPGVPYQWPGNPGLAKELAERLNQNDVPCGLNDSHHFNWDYGTYVPLQYLDPDRELPVVVMPTVICSDLGECRKVGRLIHESAVAAGQRIVFVASCALAHKVVRGPELWPSEAHQALDQQLISHFKDGKLADLAEWSTTYCKEAVAEMEGRPIQGMIGAAEAMAESMATNGQQLEGRMYGDYAQSSGSGNASLGFFAKGI